MFSSLRNRKSITEKSSELYSVDSQDGLSTPLQGIPTNAIEPPSQDVLYEMGSINADGTCTHTMDNVEIIPVTLNQTKSIYENHDPLVRDLWFSFRVELQKIDLVEQQFQVRGWLNCFWINENIMNEGGEYINEKKGKISIEDDGENQPINLEFMFENASECDVLGEPIFRFNKKTGVISEAIRFKATLSEEMELDLFPFDRQFLTMRLCIRTKEFRCLANPPDYVPDHLNMRLMSTCTYSPTLAGWIPVSPMVGFCTAKGQCDDKRITVSLRLGRDYFYWLFNFVIEVFLVVVLATTSFAVKPDEVEARMGIVLTLLLTLVTFKFIVASEIPKTSTITLLDKYLVLSYIMLLLVVVQTLFCLQVDPVMWSFLDHSCALSMLLFWLGLHLWIVKRAVLGEFSIAWDDMKDEGADDHVMLIAAPEHISLPSGEAALTSELKLSGAASVRARQALEKEGTKNTAALEAWDILRLPEKVQDADALNEALGSLGVYSGRDLAYCEQQELECISGSLKTVPRRRFRSLMGLEPPSLSSA